MMTPDVAKQNQQLQDAFVVFRSQNPEVAEAMNALSISFADYLEALDSIQGQSQGRTITGNATLNA